MTDSFRELGGGGGIEGLSKRWAAGSIQEPLLILPGIPPLPTSRANVNGWGDNQLRGRLHQRYTAWKSRLGATYDSQGSFAHFSAPPSGGIGWHGSTIDYQDSLFSPLEPASPGHSSELWLIPVADCVSRCSNGLASSLSLGQGSTPISAGNSRSWPMPSHSAMARRIGKAKRSPEWPAQKIGSAVERKEPEINQSASPRNEDVGVLKARRIHEMQISRPPNPRMTHEHRPIRRSLDSNPINREKIAAAMLRHFLHWSVSLCETRWLLHLHAQPPLRPRHHITANVGFVSAQPGRFGETTASRSEAFPSLNRVAAISDSANSSLSILTKGEHFEPMPRQVQGSAESR